MKDKFVYSMVLKGVQDAIDLHIRSIIEIIRNDSLRKLLMDFWEKEILTYDRFLKYGKMKGWLNTPPTYNELG